MAVQNLHFLLLKISHRNPNHKLVERAVKSSGNQQIKIKKDVLQELVKTLHLQKAFSEIAGGLLALLTWRVDESSHLSKCTLTKNNHFRALGISQRKTITKPCWGQLRNVQSSGERHHAIGLGSSQSYFSIEFWSVKSWLPSYLPNAFLRMSLVGSIPIVWKNFNPIFVKRACFLELSIHRNVYSKIWCLVLASK